MWPFRTTTPGSSSATPLGIPFSARLARVSLRSPAWVQPRFSNWRPTRCPTVSPLVAASDGPPAIDGYDDGSESTFGRPNEWNGGASIQDFAPYVSGGASPDPLETYLTGFGLSGADLLATADSDDDTITQLAEFAFGTDPTSGASLPVQMVEVEEASPADERLSITFLRRTGGSGKRRDLHRRRDHLHRGGQPRFNGLARAGRVYRQPGGIARSSDRLRVGDLPAPEPHQRPRLPAGAGGGGVRLAILAPAGSTGFRESKSVVRGLAPGSSELVPHRRSADATVVVASGLVR